MKHNEQTQEESCSRPTLTVVIQSFPESNGRRNWTAMFKRTTPFNGLRGNCGGITIARGEHWNRVAYEAERARVLLGERHTEPDLLEYGPDVATPQEWLGKDAEGVFAARCLAMNRQGLNPKAPNAAIGASMCKSE